MSLALKERNLQEQLAAGQLALKGCLIVGPEKEKGLEDRMKNQNPPLRSRHYTGKKVPGDQKRISTTARN